MTVFRNPDDLSDGEIDYFLRHEKDVFDIYLATSRNGIDWDYTWLDANVPVLPRGPNGSFDKDIIIPASSPVLKDGKLIVYYSGANERHSVEPKSWAISRAIWDQNRIVCQESEDGWGVTDFMSSTQNYIGLDLKAPKGYIRISLVVSEDNEDATVEYGPVTISNVDGIVRLPLTHFVDAANNPPPFGKRLAVKFSILNGMLCALSI